MMLNNSSGGGYIESRESFTKGAVVVVRVVRYPNVSVNADDGQLPRSLWLAEVKWVRSFRREAGLEHGIGLRYL